MTGPRELPSPPALEIAHVLFMDIVAYSKLHMDRQQQLLHVLQEAVRNTSEFARAQADDHLIRLPTGDGMALVFFHDPEAPVRCALELAKALRATPDVQLRMGIHTGPVYRVADINANRNVAGGGINIAQRVMDCGNAGHILVSSTEAEVLGQVSVWCPMLHDLGEVEVKHGVRLHIYNLYNEEAGNPALPLRCPSKDTAVTSSGVVRSATLGMDEAGSRRTPGAQRGWPLRLSILLVTALLLAGAGLLIYKRTQAPVPLGQRGLTKLTFDDGLQIGATWSPDGRFLAYSSNHAGEFAIWVQQIGEGEPIRVTRGPGHHWQPDWSPDGKHIAYRSEEGEGGLYIVPALGGTGRKISSFGYYPRWSPDGSQILFQTTQFAVLNKFYVVGLDGTAPRQVLTKLSAESGGGNSAAWHPDGKRVSIWVWDSSGSSQSFWTAPITGGVALQSEITPELLKQIGEVAAGGGIAKWAMDFKFSWASSGKAIYFERTFRGARNIWRMTVNPRTLQATAIERITTGAGLDTEFSLSRDGSKLAYTSESRNIRSWLFPFDASRGRVTGTGQAVTSPGTDAWRLSLSRDGQKLAFCANRAGKWELREKSLPDGQENPVVPDDHNGRGAPQWSPDGTRLAYVRANLSTGENQVVEWSLQSRNEEPLTSGPIDWQVQDWSPDGKWLLINPTNTETHREEIWSLPVAARPYAEAAAQRIISSPVYRLFQSHFSPDGRWIVFEATRNQPLGMESTLYVVSADGGPWIRITDGKHWDDKPRWSPDGKTIYFLSERGGFFNVWATRFDPARGARSGDAFPVTLFDSRTFMIPKDTPNVGLSLTQDRLVLTMEQVSGNIWVLDNVDR